MFKTRHHMFIYPIYKVICVNPKNICYTLTKVRLLAYLSNLLSLSANLNEKGYK